MGYRQEFCGTHAPSHFTEQTIPLRQARSLLYSSVCVSIRCLCRSTGLGSTWAQMMYDPKPKALSRQVASIGKLILGSKGNSCGPNSRTQHKHSKDPPLKKQKNTSVSSSLLNVSVYVSGGSRNCVLLSAVHFTNTMATFSQGVGWPCVITKLQKCSCSSTVTKVKGSNVHM